MDQNYRYKSVNIQILHNARLALICLVGFEFVIAACVVVTLPLCHSGELLKTYVYVNMRKL